MIAMQDYQGNETQNDNSFENEVKQALELYDKGELSKAKELIRKAVRNKIQSKLYRRK